MNQSVGAYTDLLVGGNDNVAELDYGCVTPCPERVYGMCNRMCTKGFLNYFSAIIEFLKVVLRVKL